CKRQAAYSLDDQSTWYHPVVRDASISPPYPIPVLSQKENPYLNSSVDLNTDMEFVVETQDENQQQRSFDFFPAT
ncbi:hypothetical protein MKW92_022092, partial [Papaver armeniacum]